MDENAYKRVLNGLLEQRCIPHLSVAHPEVRGVPDIVFWRYGRSVAIELKKGEQAKITALQIDTLQNMANEGVFAFVLTLLDGFKRTLLVRFNKGGKFTQIEILDFKKDFPDNVLNTTI